MPPRHMGALPRRRHSTAGGAFRTEYNYPQVSEFAMDSLLAAMLLSTEKPVKSTHDSHVVARRVPVSGDHYGL